MYSIIMPIFVDLYMANFLIMLSLPFYSKFKRSHQKNIICEQCIKQKEILDDVLQYNTLTFAATTKTFITTNVTQTNVKIVNSTHSVYEKVVTDAVSTSAIFVQK